MNNISQAFSTGVLFGVGFGIIISILWSFHKKWKKYRKEIRK
jgi:hypothetical protein